ncbi:VWA domain-containing protein [Lysobacter sp. CFH 32150]|uniref:VWA domain-containing protein n=1 Tax=Lysobacter sp. CFH 32150 TaxID=2927128 RepID=UPI001FA7FAEF|nr:VWA domain-containing protein [Lysobacter sp. CFH 32150]
MIDVLPTLHFVRPDWLWALLALPLLAWWWRARRRRESVWRGVVDPHLLPHLLETAPDLRTRGAMLIGALAYALAVVALAGPAWQLSEQPLWQSKAPLVIALDLSSTAMASDLPPSRLLQARAKLATLLRERAGGQVGLVAYAGDAFTVAPLTDDAGNVALFLDALAPDVMPVDGQRTDRAIAWSMRLLNQAGFDRGDILLLTDHADAEARSAAATAARSGYRVSALGLGTEAGAAYRDRDGRIGRTRLDAGSLSALAKAGGGRYATLATDAADLRALGVLDPQQTDTASARGTTGQHWQDEGYWLLPPLLLLALLAFRRGGATMTALLALALLPMLPAHAQESSTLWRRPDQLAHARMAQGTEAYRKNDFGRAAQAWTGLDSADAHYNRGNALAKQGQYPQAIAAYDDALRVQPGMADALANKRAVEAAMKRKPPQGQKRDNRGQKNQQQQSQGGQNPQSGASSQPSKPGQSQQQQGAQSRGNQRPSPPSQSAQQPQPAKPVDAETQRAADAAQRERMQRALAQARGGKAGERAQAQAQARAETSAERERRLATEAWLKRIPDDPGGLLRAKFRLEYERRQRQGAD